MEASSKTTENVTGLTENVTQLCQLHLRGRKRAYFIQPTQTKDELTKQLRKRCYDVLFDYLKRPPKPKGILKLGPKERILAYGLKLRWERKFDEASRLEVLLGKLHCQKDDAVTAMLDVLSRLSDSSPTEDTPTIGQLTNKYPIVFGDKDSRVVLPSGPRVYGDSRKVMKSYDPFYMHYPRELFENCAPLGPDLPLNTLCSLTPGDGLSGFFGHSVQGNLNDPYEKDRRSTLFGALVQGNVSSSSLDVRLDIPDITDKNKMFEIQIPKCQQSDEGFISNSGLSSSVDSSELDNSDDDDFWEQVKNYIPSKHYTWETRGKVPGPTERPYLPAAGPQAVAEIYDQWQRELQILGADSELLKRVEISHNQLVKDVINLLIGIPSKSFTINQDKDEFVIRPGVCVSGLTPHTVSHFLEDLIQCGSQHYRLWNFSKAPVLDSFYQKGLVFQAFCVGIRTYLQRYRAAVLSLPCDKTLLEIKLLCVRITQQIRFVANLCKCEKSKEDQEFPKGVMLLSYVYRETLLSLNTDNYPLMLSILRTTLTPYCLFVQDWVYHGTYRDVYGEFMFEVNTDYLQYRDKRYWTKGYTLTSRAAEENVPVFLSHLAEEIFTCGKALNLLKLCSPKHFLCNLDEREIPQVMLSFSLEDLSSLRYRCEVYVSRMQQISKQVIISREETKRRAQQARIELMERAKEASIKDMARYQAKVLAYRTVVDIKKRKAFRELKEQMEEDLQRRAKEKSQEKADDKQIMDKMTRREELMDRREAELELQARAELIEMYSKMTEEAAHRERKALWRIERAKLAAVRLEFLVEQEVAWRKELKESYQSMGVVEREREAEGMDAHDGGELPRWAERANKDDTMIISEQTSEEPLIDLSSGEPGRIVTANSEKSTLPFWVQKTIRSSNLPALQVKTDDLPAWALKELKPEEDYNGVVVVAVESATPEAGLLTFPEAEKESQTRIFTKPKTETDIPATSTNCSKPAFEAEEYEGSKNPEVSPENQENTETELLQTATEDVSQISVFNETLNISDNVFNEGMEDMQSDLKRKYGYSPSKWRTKVKVIGEITAETAPHAERPHIHIVGDHHASVESEPVTDAKPSVRHVPNYQVTTETQQNLIQKSSIQINPNFHSTTESREEESKPQIRTFGQTVNKQSEGSLEGLLVPHFKHQEGRHVSLESTPVEKKSKKASIYGHISQLSNMEFVVAPKLKRSELLHVGMESDFKNFAIKPNIRLNKRMSATTETSESVSRPGIRISGQMYASKESELSDVDAERLSRFKNRNLYGHSSDSTVQKLLYGEKFGLVDMVDGEMEDSDQETVFEKFDLTLKSIPSEPYPVNFDFIGDNLAVDLLSNVLDGRGRFGNFGNRMVDTVEYDHVTPLSVLLKKSITMPLLAQISLVNDCVLSYFTSELQIDEHFQALRRYLFMGDGDFALILSDMLFEKLSVSPRPKEMLNHIFLHRALTRSLRSSIHTDDKYAENISLALNYTPKVLNQNAPDCLDCLELQYKVDWPLNIIITDNCLSKYSKVFSYMLQLRRIVWVLKEVWYKLKGDAVIMKAGNSSQFRQLQLFRQEMQHFVKVMQGYIANQIIQVTWQEFQEALNQHVHNLDQLHRVHAEYLDMAIFRCLLNQKAEPVMKIIQNIFSIILKFRSQLISASWQKSSTTREANHPHFSNMVNTYQLFKKYSAFLFTVVNKLGTRGYQPHLDELLLRLNFNNYYKD